MQDANLDDDFDDIFDQTFGVLLVARLKSIEN